MSLSADEGLTLRYGGLGKFVGNCIGVIALAAVVGLFVMPEKREGLLIACAFFVPVAFAAFLETGRVTVCTEDAVTECSAFGRISSVAWSDVRSVHFSTIRHRFTLRATDGTRVRIGGACVGITPVARILATSLRKFGGAEAVDKWHRAIHRE